MSKLGKVPYYIALFAFISMVIWFTLFISYLDIWSAIILSALFVGLPTILYYLIMRIKNDNRKREKGWYLSGAGCFILLGGWLLVCSLLWINILLTKKVLTRNLAPNETPAYYIALVISIPIVILCFYGAYTCIKRIERDKKEGYYESHQSRNRINRKLNELTQVISYKNRR